MMVKQVYKGILPSGKLLAIKRAQQGSSQGELEFKTEIELLSRVHHKNVVKLLGFCFDRNEQMLVYEYIPNGSLTDSLSGSKSISNHLIYIFTSIITFRVKSIPTQLYFIL